MSPIYSSSSFSFNGLIDKLKLILWIFYSAGIIFIRYFLKDVGRCLQERRTNLLPLHTNPVWYEDHGHPQYHPSCRLHYPRYCWAIQIARKRSHVLRYGSLATLGLMAMVHVAQGRQCRDHREPRQVDENSVLRLDCPLHPRGHPHDCRRFPNSMRFRYEPDRLRQYCCRSQSHHHPISYRLGRHRHLLLLLLLQRHQKIQGCLPLRMSTTIFWSLTCVKAKLCRVLHLNMKNKFDKNTHISSIAQFRIYSNW